VIGSIDSSGRGPHNTVVSRDGDYVFMGPRGSNYLVMTDTATNMVIRQIGPVTNGVRPFTINGRATLAFITTTGFLGFAVGDINSGRILDTIQVQGFPTTGGAASAPSHGISLSPDEEEIYLDRYAGPLGSNFGATDLHSEDIITRHHRIEPNNIDIFLAVPVRDGLVNNPYVMRTSNAVTSS
jgi:DNA-binding beta-propeller fold protein YncE